MAEKECNPHKFKWAHKIYQWYTLDKIQRSKALCSDSANLWMLKNELKTPQVKAIRNVQILELSDEDQLPGRFRIFPSWRYIQFRLPGILTLTEEDSSITLNYGAIETIAEYIC